ncbi:uncharacterized protein LOC113314954 [Papaver somniferum]|uniref:uncharacterized protein LOC113314954 n=1 Tax=Papaver somniferum TaxID=3469 RepID=UPI000E6FBC1E|nr:uncharacterized protein LOC113314954 [Papaver somniferum]
MLPKLEREVQVMCGFGYIPSTNVYKVVRMYELSDKHVQVEVYTLGSGQGWRDIGQLEHAVRCYLLPGVFANGAVHWLNTEQTIFSFDLADEKFSQFPSPTFLPRPGNRLSLGLLGDNLCATYGNSDRFSSYNPFHRNHDRSFDIWLLKKNKDDHGMSWIKQFNLVGYEPFAFTKSGGLLCYGSDRKNIYHYNPKDASSKMVIKCGYLNLEAVLHKNTFVGLRS